MKRAIITLIAALAIGGCTTIRYVPIQGETIVKDSLIVETRIDTVKVQLPPEKVRDWTGLTGVLEMETSVAISRSWVDTTKGILTGELVNKEKPLDVAVPSTHTLEKKDSVIYKEVPIEVEKIEYRTPKWAWYSLVINILGLMLGALVIYLKVKGKFLK